MSDVCEAPEVPEFGGTFNGKSSDITVYDGAPLVCIAPTGPGLNPILEALEVLCTALNANVTDLDDTKADKPSGGDTHSILRTDAAAAEAWETIPEQRVIGRLTGGLITALDDADIFNILGILASAAEINILDGVTATTAEINFLSGVTGSIQTQIDDIVTDVSDIQKSLDDGLKDFVGLGLTTTDAGGLNVDIAVGRATIEGVLVEKTAITNLALPATQDNYIYLDINGAFSIQSVAVAAPEPAQPAQTVKIAKVETGAGSIVSITDLRNLFSVGETQLCDDSVSQDKLKDDSVGSDQIIDGSVGPDELADTAVVPGAYTNADITVDQDGRITSAANGATLIPDKNATTTTGGAPLTVFAFNHALGKYPAVTVLDSSGNEIIAGIVHNDVDNITVTFSPAITNATISCN